MSKWDELPLREKAEMMRVAVENGMSSLPEIKKAYNSFAGGGPISDSDYYAIMEDVARKNNAEWNADRLREGRPALSVGQEYMRILNDNSYDYRGYYNKYPESRANANTHWPDEFKTVYHPTFSTESVYSGVKDRNFNPEGRKGGEWLNVGGKEQFLPDYWQEEPDKYWFKTANKFGPGGPEGEESTPQLGDLLKVTPTGTMITMGDESSTPGRNVFGDYVFTLRPGNKEEDIDWEEGLPEVIVGRQDTDLIAPINRGMNKAGKIGAAAMALGFAPIAAGALWAAAPTISLNPATTALGLGASFAAGDAFNQGLKKGTGMSWPEFFSKGMQNATGWNPQETWWGNVIADTSNPFYAFGPMFMEKAGNAYLSSAAKNTANISQGYNNLKHPTYRTSTAAFATPDYSGTSDYSGKPNLELLRKYILNNSKTANTSQSFNDKYKYKFNNVFEDYKSPYQSRISLRNFNSYINYDLGKMSVEDAERTFGPIGATFKKQWDIAAAHNFEGKYKKIAEDIEKRIKNYFAISKTDPDISYGIQKARDVYDIPEYRKRFERWGSLGETFIEDAKYRLDNVKLQGIEDDVSVRTRYPGIHAGGYASIRTESNGNNTYLIGLRNMPNSDATRQIVQHEAGHMAHGMHTQPKWMEIHNEKIRPVLKPGIDPEKNTTKYFSDMDEIVTRAKTTIQCANDIRKPGESLDDAIDRLLDIAEQKPNFDLILPSDVMGLTNIFTKESLSKFLKNFVGGTTLTTASSAILNNKEAFGGPLVQEANNLP